MLDDLTKKWINAEVTDPQTGLKGTVAALLYYMSGTVQAMIQPRNPKGDKVLEACSIDIEVLKINKKPPKNNTVMSTTALRLGDKVKDTATGFTGVITLWQRCHNGCISLIVEPPVDKDGKICRSVVFDSTRLNLVKPAAEPKGRQTNAAGAGCLPRRSRQRDHGVC